MNILLNPPSSFELIQQATPYIGQPYGPHVKGAIAQAQFLL